MNEAHATPRRSEPQSPESRGRRKAAQAAEPETGAAFANVYEDPDRAAAYADLAFPGTYHLAFRDLPAIIAEHASGREALDFGCGAGRSTRFLTELGFRTVGIDISASMIQAAQAADPQGKYVLVPDGDLAALGRQRFDLILAAFPFDNIAGAGKRRRLLSDLGGFLGDRGRIIVLGSAAEIYLHEWVSFTTAAFPENRAARSGDTVRIVMKDVSDRRPVEDILWFHEDYLDLFAAARLELISSHRPLGRKDDPVEWLTETSISPWAIYVLGKSGG